MWELAATHAAGPPHADLRGPHIHGSPGRRFLYLSWGTVDDHGEFTMFRRAKLWLDAVPAEVMAAAGRGGVLVGSLGLSDDRGWPLCAAVRPPKIVWRAGEGPSPRTDPGRAQAGEAIPGSHPAP